MPEPSVLASDLRTPDRSLRLAKLAGGQWGVVARWQLDKMGFSAATIARWRDASRLHRLYPGVYALGHPNLGPEGRLAAALFYAGRGATLSHPTAAWRWGFIGSTAQEIHISAPGDRRSVAGVHVHHPRRIDRVWYRRLPVTPPAQTLLDIADMVPAKELRRALSEAEYLKLVTLDEVRQVLGRGKSGSAALRAALERHTPLLSRTKPGTEEEFLLLCERHSLTPSAVNVWIAGWCVDAVWYAQRVVVELDSRLAHDASWRLERDHRRDLDLRAAGYTVLRYTWQQVTQTPDRVVADLRRALGARVRTCGAARA
jgi:very-short-patch-repair endonuclease